MKRIFISFAILSTLLLPVSAISQTKPADINVSESSHKIVTLDNFTRAETDRMFRDIAFLAGKVNSFYHIRQPTPLDRQTVIRMNRDTLYSGAVIDTGGKGATISVPAMPDGRYASVLLIDNDHYAVGVIYDPGVHKVPADTKFVFAGVRIQIFNPDDPEEISLINSLQDQFSITASSADALPSFQWDNASLDQIRNELELGARRFPNWEGMMGARGKVDPILHRYATAAAWGLFPEQHATYFNYNGGHDYRNCYTATYPIPKNEAFWSITMYGKTGFIEYENSVLNAHNTQLNQDGKSFTAYFGSKESCGDVPNRLDTSEGWNFLMRVYRPDPSVLGGGYVLPTAVPIR